MSRLGDSPGFYAALNTANRGYQLMALTLTPLGVTAGSPWRQPWGWESLNIRSPGGATDFAYGKTGQTGLPPHPGLTVWMQTYPTAYAVGYLLPPLRG